MGFLCALRILCGENHAGWRKGAGEGARIHDLLRLRYEFVPHSAHRQQMPW
jgi:hypothetical protein